MVQRTIFAALCFYLGCSGAARAGGAVAIAECQDITIQLDDTGNYFLMPEEVDNGSVYDTGLMISQEFFTCADAGLVVPVTLTAESSGENDECTANVTVEDVTPPVVFGTNVVVQLDGSGHAWISPEDADAGSYDNCDTSPIIDLDHTFFTCSDVGDVSALLTVTDVSGNSAFTPVTITVQDVIPPDFVTCTTDIYSEVAAGYQRPLPDFSIGASTLDDCTALISYQQIPPPGTMVSSGTNAVELWAIDYYENSNKCDAVYILTGVSPPDIVMSSAGGIGFGTSAGRIYAVEYSEELTGMPQEWATLSNNIVGNGSPVVINDPDGATNRNYRLRVQLIE